MNDLLVFGIAGGLGSLIIVILKAIKILETGSWYDFDRKFFIRSILSIIAGAITAYYLTDILLDWVSSDKGRAFLIGLAWQGIIYSVLNRIDKKALIKDEATR